jgi:hypothetical protein
VAIEAAPVFLGALDQLEHHGEGRPVREATFGSDGSVADGRERALDRVGRSQVFPMLGREVIECLIPKASTAVGVLYATRLSKSVNVNLYPSLKVGSAEEKYDW